MLHICYDDYMKKHTKATYRFLVLIERDSKGFYVARVPSLKSCYTQAKSLPVLYKRLDEVVKLCLSVEKKDRMFSIPQNEFVGAQQFEFSV